MNTNTNDIVLVLPTKPLDQENLESLLSTVSASEPWHQEFAPFWAIGIRAYSRRSGNLIMASHLNPGRVIHVVTVGQLQEVTLNEIKMLREKFRFSWTRIKWDLPQLVGKAVENLVSSNQHLTVDQRLEVCTLLRSTVEASLGMMSI